MPRASPSVRPRCPPARPARSRRPRPPGARNAAGTVQGGQRPVVDAAASSLPSESGRGGAGGRWPPPRRGRTTTSLYEIRIAPMTRVSPAKSGGRPGRSGVPDPLRDADHGEGQGQRDNELRRFRRALQPAHETDLEDDAQGVPARTSRRRTTRASASPIRCASANRRMRQHPDRAVRPIEDARGGVGQREAARRDGVDAGGRQAPDGEDDEVMHVRPPTALFVV